MIPTGPDLVTGRVLNYDWRFPKSEFIWAPAAGDVTAVGNLGKDHRWKNPGGY